MAPSDQTSINKIEAVQRSLVNQVRDHKLVVLNYWKKLNELGVYSEERRRERYIIIFLWKISQGMVSGYSVEFAHGRNGRTIVPRPYVRTAPTSVRNARERSLGV